jgi:small subunit ribosomal protein S16
MALKIRLSRGGSKKRPFYRIVVAEAAAPRDGRYVERIGHYNPMVAKDNDQRLVIDGERVKHWIGLGAKPTERVQKLLSTLSLTAPVEMRDQPKKSAPGKKRAEREAEEAAAAEAAAAEAAEAAAAAAEAPAEEAPAEEAPAEEATAEETPAEEAPAEEVAAEEEKPADA